jgi:hypothetical protein
MVSMLFALIFYFTPAIIASVRDHRNAVPIFLTNLLAGWTVFGWIFAFIWAFTN